MSYIFTNFQYTSLLIAEGGILKSSTVIIYLPLSPFSSSSSCFLHFEALLLGTYIFRTIIYLMKLTFICCSLSENSCLIYFFQFYHCLR